MFFFIDSDMSEHNDSNSHVKGTVLIKYFMSFDLINAVFHYVSVPPRYDPVFRLSPPPSPNIFPCLIDPSQGAFEAFDIKPK
jgi:hypothetical protein